MSASLAISLGALVVSMVAAGFSIYFNARERPRLEATSEVSPGDDEHPPTLQITAINSGRRPLIIRMWVGTDDRGEWAGTLVGERQQGRRLGEYERYDLTLESADLGLFHGDVEIEFTELWFEDTLGRRHRIKDSRAHIKKFWAKWAAYSDARDSKRKMQELVARQVRAALDESRS